MGAFTVSPLASSGDVGVSDVVRGLSPKQVPEIPSTRSRAAIALLDRKHPDVAVKERAWRDLTLLYEGGQLLKQNVESVLRKRPREDTEVYVARKEMFVYENLLGPALGWYLSAMFKEDPEIQFKPKRGPDIPKIVEYYSDEFVPNVDGVGTHLKSFIERSFIDSLLYGRSYILVDRPKGQSDPDTSLADQKASGELDVRLVRYLPTQVINWDRDEVGNFNWVVIKEVTLDQGEFLGKVRQISRWYYFDRTDYRIYEDRADVGNIVRITTEASDNRMAELIDSGKHAMSDVGRVPIKEFCLGEGMWLANRVYLLLLDHLNQENSLAWGLFMSNLAIPVIIGDYDGNNMNNTEAGFLQFPAGTTYQWSEPEGKSFSQSALRIDHLREEAYRGLHLQAQGRSMHATPAMQSGRSKQLEMSPAIDVLSKMGDSVRMEIQDVLNMVVAARGEADILKPDVRGFEFHDEMTTEEVFAVSSTMSLRIPSKTFEKYLHKKVAQAWMRDSNPDEIETVYEEIDSGPTMDERLNQEMQKRIELAKAGLSKAAPPLPKQPGVDPTQPPGRGGSGPAV